MIQGKQTFNITSRSLKKSMLRDPLTYIRLHAGTFLYLLNCTCLQWSTSVWCSSCMCQKYKILCARLNKKYTTCDILIQVIMTLLSLYSLLDISCSNSLSSQPWWACPVTLSSSVSSSSSAIWSYCGMRIGHQCRWEKSRTRNCSCSPAHFMSLVFHDNVKYIPLGCCVSASTSSECMLFCLFTAQNRWRSEHQPRGSQQCCWRYKKHTERISMFFKVICLRHLIMTTRMNPSVGTAELVGPRMWAERGPICTVATTQSCRTDRFNLRFKYDSEAFQG